MLPLSPETSLLLLATRMSLFFSRGGPASIERCSAVKFNLSIERCPRVGVVCSESTSRSRGAMFCVIKLCTSLAMALPSLLVLLVRVSWSWILKPSLTRDLSRFPQYVKAPFYLTSESYGGHYLPTLAVKLASDKSVNFKGFAVGNPLTWMPLRDYGQYATYAAHQVTLDPDLISVPRLCIGPDWMFAVVGCGLDVCCWACLDGIGWWNA